MNSIPAAVGRQFSLKGWSLNPASTFPPEMELSTRQVWTDSTASLTVSRAGDAFLISFWDQPGVWIDPAKRCLFHISPSADLPSEALHHFLADQILPRLVAHDGALVLHGGAVSYPAGAVAILGQSGRGKSTLVGSLQRPDNPILSDDALILGREDVAVSVRAVYPGLRLMPDSIAALFSGPIETDPVAYYTEKQRVRVAAATDSGRHPLAMLILLDPPGDATAVTLRRMRPMETCMELIANSFALDPTDRQRAAADLVRASAVAARVPAFALSYPRDYSRLAEVRSAILDQLTQSAATVGD